MKNVSHSPVTEMLSGKYKIWLMIGLVLLPIADLSACIVLWIFGAASSYWLLPFLMTVADLAYLLGVALSNQRFKYAQTLFVFYILATVILIIIWLSQSVLASTVIYGNATVIAWSLLHGVGIAMVGITYLYATRRVRGGRFMQLVLSIAFCVIALGCVAYYSVDVIGSGYFGQGGGTLPLVYNYIGDDECEVTDVVYGKGDSVIVPYEFNGRKVTSVSSKVFTYTSIKSVTLNCDSTAMLCADMRTSTLNTNINIYVDKKDVDAVKQQLYALDSADYRYRHALGNNVRPIGLDKDEVYVTFDYDYDSYDTAQGSIIPTWYGKKGDTFKLTDIDGVDYVRHSDASNDDDLYYCYNNVGYNGGYILSELNADGIALDGMTIDGSRNNVQVRFQKVYKIFAGESNDTMYSTAEHMEFSIVNGEQLGYKLTVAQNAEKILEGFDRGDAFIRTMKYRLGSVSYREFTSIADVLKMGYSDITIAPHWQLAKPQVSLSRIDGAANVIYGNDFELSAAVTHPIGEVQAEYEWKEKTDGIGYEQNLSYCATTVGDVKYTVTVTVRAPQVTSCVATRSADITINVRKRPLTITWEHRNIPIMGEEAKIYGTESVFDGVERIIQPKAQNVVNDDFVFFMGHAGYNAGTHTVNATLSSDIAEKYYIADGETYTYTIHPRPVPLTWDDDTEFEYDGNPHCPTAHALDLSGAELTIWYTGIQTNAGENYTATATLPYNSDYTIDESSEKSKGFKITPKPVTVAWSIDQLIYNGNVQAPQVTTIGSVGGETVAINVTGGQTDANVVNGNVTTTYIAVATSANKNYTLVGSTNWQYTIEPYGVTVDWTNTTLMYNGQGRLPNASAVGVKSQVITATVSIAGYQNGAINAGSYTATATIADTNYTITSGSAHAFTISKRTVRAEWDDASLIYNGEFQVPSATAKGVDGVDLPLTVTGAGVKIGSGTATGAFASEQKNYTLTNTSITYTVNKKVLDIVIDNVTVEYGQRPDYTYSIAGVVDGDYVTVTFKVNYQADGNGNIPAGEYTIIATLSISDSTSYSLNVVQSGKLTVTQPDETED